MTQQQLDMEMEQRNVTRTINVPLTPGEEHVVMKELIELRQEERKADKAFEQVKSAHKGNMNDIKSRTEKLLDQAEHGTPQNVECIEKRFYGTNTIQVWHAEKMIEERAMTADERQMSITDAQEGVVVEAEFKTVGDSDEFANRKELAQHIKSESRAVDAPNGRLG